MQLATSRLAFSNSLSLSTGRSLLASAIFLPFASMPLPRPISASFRTTYHLRSPLPTPGAGNFLSGVPISGIK